MSARKQGLTGVRGTVLAPQPDRSLVSSADGIVVWDEDGVIRHAGPFAAVRDEPVQIIDTGSPAVIVPGFVDAHVHLPQLALRGRNAAPLLEWLQEHVFAEESALAEGEAATVAADHFERALLACGTTAAGVYVTVHESATRIALERLGVRGLVGKVLMDRAAPPALCEAPAVGVAATERLLAAFPDRVAVTPRFAVGCTAELLAAAGDLARRSDAPILTHLAENEQETALVRELFKERRSYTDVYAAAGLLTSRTLLAHAIHLDEEDWRVLARAGSAVIHCPTANEALASGRMPLEAVRAHDVRFALGTDVGAGPSLSLWHVIEAYLRVHRGRAEVTPEEALYRATRAGAELLGVASGFGPGLPADLAVFRRPEGVDRGASGGELVRALAAATREQVEPEARLTVIGGRVVHEAAL